MKETFKAPPDLRHRTLFNGLFALILALCIFFAEFHFFRIIFTAFVAALASVAIFEYYNLARRKAFAPATVIGIVGTILYTFAVFAKTQGPYHFMNSFWQHAPETVLGLTLFSSFIFYAVTRQPSIANIAITFFGIVYVAVPLGLIVRIVYFFTFGGQEDPNFQGSFWQLYLIVVTKSADMGGYFIGSSFGRRKLATRLSPNKTLEGAIGGLIASIGLSLFLCWLGKKLGYASQDFSYIQALWLGAMVSVAGQLGDLAESLLKRDAGAKGSNSLPGVGGILDMVDSLLFTGPLLYIFLRIQYTYAL